MQPVGYCPKCGAPRGEPSAAFCPHCGSAFEPALARVPARARPSRPLVRPATLLLTFLVVVGGLWVVNNTRLGVSVKCHLLGETGACVEEALLQAVAPVIQTNRATNLQQVTGGDAPCAIRLSGHNATVLVGIGGYAGCDAVRTRLSNIGSWLDVSTQSAASSGSQLCEGNWNGVHVQVLDTGAQIYGSDACQELGL